VATTFSGVNVHRSPTVAEHLLNLAFFVVVNAVLLGAAWRKGRRARGLFRWLYYLPVAPLVLMVASLSWQWLSDVTAASLWPLGMMLLAVPCWLTWRAISWFERRREASH
jgi:ABC-type sugar transport system permease subunit